MKKRALALVLSICVAFSVVPEEALAEEPVEMEAEANGKEENLAEEPDFEEESEQIQEEVQSSDDTYTEKEPENAEKSQSESEIDIVDELAQEGSGEAIDAEQGDTSKYVQTAYFYITINNSAWYYAGIGSVNALKAAGSIAGSRYTAGVVKSYPSSMPNITFNGITYTYDNRSNADGNTYRVNWEYATVSRGANNGSIIITNDYVWHVDGQIVFNGSGGLSLSRDNFNFINAPEDFMTDEKRQKWYKAYLLDNKSNRSWYDNKVLQNIKEKNKWDIAMQMSPGALEKILAPAVLANNAVLIKDILETRTKLWTGSCYGLSVVMAIRCMDEKRLPLRSICPENKNLTNTYGLQRPRDDVHVADLVNYYQLSYSYAQVWEAKLAAEVRRNLQGAVNGLMNNVKNGNVPVIACILKVSAEGVGESAHAVLILKLLSEDAESYTVQVYDPNDKNELKKMIIYKNRTTYAQSKDWIPISYNTSSNSVEKKDEYTALYNYVAGLDKMDQYNYFSNEIVKSNIKMPKKVTIPNSVNLCIMSDDVELQYESGHIKKNTGVYMPVADLSEMDGIEDDGYITFYFEDDIDVDDMQIQLSSDEDKGVDAKIICGDWAAEISGTENINAVLSDRRIEVTSEITGNISAQIIDNEASNKCDWNTVAATVEDAKTLDFSLDNTGMNLDSDNLQNAEVAAGTYEEVKSKEINTDEESVKIGFKEDQGDKKLEIKENPSVPEPDVDKSSWLYNDVPEKTGWRYEAIKYVKDHGIMNGISGTRNFAPDEPLTRAMFATIIYRMEGSPKASYSTKFPDVPDGNYFSVPIIWANKAGIINGHSNTGLFGTRENITREDMVVIMYRYCRVKGLESGGRADLSRFPDADQISGYAKEAVQWAVANGIINGRSNTGMLDPKGSASRVETAAVIQRFMNKIMK